jgi:hypothetical protein
MEPAMQPLRTLIARHKLSPDEVIPQVSDDELLEWGAHLRSTPSPSEPTILRALRPGRPLRAAPAGSRKVRVRIAAID